MAALGILDGSTDATALTMRALAARLGVQAPSLYAHIDGIDDVLDLVHELINSSIDLSPLLEGTDLEDLRAFGRNYRDSYRRHRVAATIISARSLNQDHALRVYEAIAAFLARRGLPDNQIMPLMAMLDSVVLGSAVEPFADGFVETARTYGRQYPTIAAGLRSTRRKTIDDAGFELGLDAFLATVERLTPQ